MTKTHAALVLALLSGAVLSLLLKGDPRMIPNPVSSRGYIDLTTVAVASGSHHATHAWLAAGAAGAAQDALVDYATFNAPLYMGAGALVSPLAGADEVIVNIRNVGTAFPVVGGKPIAVQFAWTDGEGGTYYEMAQDNAPAGAVASAIVVGATDGAGTALAVRRYQTDVAEYQIELNEGRSFRLVVKAPFLTVGVAAIGGAPGATQVVMMQMLPRTIGVPRSNG